MAIAQKIGLTGLSPVNRMPALGPVTDLDGLPVEELTEKEPVFYNGGTFHYEDLLDQQNHMQNRREVTSAKPDRKINTSMVAATTQCFTDAFGISITSVLRSIFTQPCIMGKVKVGPGPFIPSKLPHLNLAILW